MGVLREEERRIDIKRIYEIMRAKLVLEDLIDQVRERRFGIPDDSGSKKVMSKEEGWDEVILDDDGYKIIKNPKSLDGLSPKVRGIIIGSDLYIENYARLLHVDIIRRLQFSDILSKNVDDVWWQRMPKEFLTVQRRDNSDEILIGESNDRFNGLSKPVYKLYMSKVQERYKNGKIKFVAEKIKNGQPDGLLESELNEAVVGYIVSSEYGNYREEIKVIKNPVTLKNIVSDCRGVSDNEGNLYIVNTGDYDVIHSMLINWLFANKYLGNDNLGYKTPWGWRGIMCWQRDGDSKKMLMSESYKFSKIDDYANEILNKLHKKLEWMQVSKGSEIDFELTQIYSGEKL